MSHLAGSFYAHKPKVPCTEICSKQNAFDVLSYSDSTINYKVTGRADLASPDLQHRRFLSLTFLNAECLHMNVLYFKQLCVPFQWAGQRGELLFIWHKKGKKCTLHVYCTSSFQTFLSLLSPCREHVKHANIIDTKI